MPLKHLTITDFRCLASVEFQPGPQYNLIYGANASGKTSLLEAIAYLGRGRSFRGAATHKLVRHGCSEFLLVGVVERRGRARKVGVRNGREGLELHIDGRSDGGVAALAEALPLQIVDPDIHNLVAGGPEQRRRYLDWIVFHVEHGYLDQWRRYRRALKQRNAGLREGAGAAEIRVWDQELGVTAALLDQARSKALAIAQPVLERTASSLLGATAGFEYRRGWPDGTALADLLADTADRDRQLGATQAGPHRADIRLIHDERQARKLVSRGQQKLLACSMVIAACEVVQAALGEPLLLLLDDPAAELDSASLSRLMDAVAALNCQVIATSLTPDTGLFPQLPLLFHVEHCRIAPPA